MPHCGDILKMWDQTRLSHDPRPLPYFGNILTLGCPLHIKISTKFLSVLKGHVLNRNLLGPKGGVISFFFTKFLSVFKGHVLNRNFLGPKGGIISFLKWVLPFHGEIIYVPSRFFHFRQIWTIERERKLNFGSILTWMNA